MKEIRNESVTYAFEQALRSLTPTQRRPSPAALKEWRGNGFLPQGLLAGRTSVGYHLKYETSPEVYEAYKDNLLARVPVADREQRMERMDYLTYAGIPIVLNDELPKNEALLVTRDGSVSVMITLDSSVPDPRTGT